MAQITLQSVYKSYDGTEAVKDLSLSVAEGEFLALLGPPGAGKSSTLKMIAGVEPVTSGDILFDGERVNRLPPNKRNVAMVFESYALYPHLTAFDNIAYPLREQKRQLGLSEEQVAEQVHKMAERLQITPQLERQPRYLSGGQRQRVALARSLVRSPAAYLLDEPIAHLDARLRHTLRGEIKRMQRSRGVTTVYSTPDYLEAVAMADRIAVLFGGEVHQLAAPAELLKQPASARVAEFVGDPPMNVLPAQVAAHDDRLWLCCDGFELSAPDNLAVALRAGQHERVLVGIRPGDIQISRTETGNAAFVSPLYAVEHLHRKSILNLQQDDRLIKIITAPGFEGRVGEQFWVAFPPDKVHVFDADSLRALVAPG